MQFRVREGGLADRTIDRWNNLNTYVSSIIAVAIFSVIVFPLLSWYIFDQMDWTIQNNVIGKLDNDMMIAYCVEETYGGSWHKDWVSRPPYPVERSIWTVAKGAFIIFWQFCGYLFLFSPLIFVLNMEESND